jgi:hypothetical protein
MCRPGWCIAPVRDVAPGLWWLALPAAGQQIMPVPGLTSTTAVGLAREDILIRVASQLEQAVPWSDRHPLVHM